LAAQIEGHQIEGWREKFGRPTKIAVHLEGLLEINFLTHRANMEMEAHLIALLELL